LKLPSERRKIGVGRNQRSGGDGWGILAASSMVRSFDEEVTPYSTGFSTRRMASVEMRS
jgi:hypothetical protein